MADETHSTGHKKSTGTNCKMKKYFKKLSALGKQGASMPAGPKVRLLSRLFFLLASLNSVSVFAAAQSVQISQGRVVSYEQQIVENAAATLVFLPGINRGLSFATEVNYLSSKVLSKYNIISVSSSLHPQSIGKLPAGTPFLTPGGELTSQDLADEVEVLLKKLKIKNPIIISLSYSSSIMAALKGQSYLGFIEMVPMTDPLDGDSATQRFLRDQQDLAMLNPFFAPGIRYQRDSIYRSVWSTQVDEILAKFPEQYGQDPRVEDIKEGYFNLARAVEDFRLSKVSSPLPRHFILAENELEYRLKNQIQAAIAENQKTDGNTSFVMVADSGHIMPSENPTSAAIAVDKVVQALLKGETIKGRVQGKKLTLYSQESLQKMGF